MVRRGGRPAKLTAEQMQAVRDLYRAGSLTVAQIAEQYHVSRPTIYHSL